jgi:ATP-binding cassette subfamily B protein
LGLFFILWQASFEIVEGNMSVGDLVLISALVMQICIPLAFIGSIYKELRQCQADIHKLEPILLGISENALTEDKAGVYIKNLAAGPRVRFENVTFGYQDQKKILNNITFEVQAGTTTAIVGTSGSGKTTLLRLLLGFYQPDSGAVYIDDQNIKNVSLNHLRQIISVIPQDPSLFNRSIAYNIRYGNITASLERFKASVSAAQLDGCLASLPHGYDSVVGERGQKLSGGERQRVAIARALIRSSSIYVFDEATSALDSETEKQFQSAMVRISSNKTTIIVAHRLATIMNAHQIIVIDGGEILETGTHDSLLEQGGVYSSMWLSQQKSAV